MDYRIIQINGQKICELTENIPAPPRGCEIFVKGLPEDIMEHDLFNLFGKFGCIYKIRLMLDFDGGNRGYAFITYFEKIQAKKAIKEMNHTYIKEKRIIVTASIDNRNLYIRNIPREINKADVKIALRNIIYGIKDVIMHRDPHRPELNRGYAFIEFIDHASAAIARRTLTTSNLLLWDRNVFTDWAEPILDLNDEIMAKVKRLFFSNIPLYYTANEFRKFLYSILYEYKDKIIITRVYKDEDYGFVHFKTRQMAELALNLLNNLKIDGFTLIVEWARPQCFSRKHLIKSNLSYYQSQPPPKPKRSIPKAISPLV